MRETIRDIDRLRHIYECIEHINDYLNGKSFEDLTADIMCYHDVVYNTIVVGTDAWVYQNACSRDLHKFKLKT